MTRQLFSVLFAAAALLCATLLAQQPAVQQPAAVPGPHADLIKALSESDLTNAAGIVSKGQKYLQGAKLIGLYFSAHWCPPCRAFTPKLVSFRNQCRGSNLPFEVVFVSSDRDAKAMLAYMNETQMKWPGIPYGSPLVQKARSRFKVNGIPTLVILDSNGNLITSSGRMDVESSGPMAYNHWMQMTQTLQKGGRAAPSSM